MKDDQTVGSRLGLLLAASAMALVSACSEIEVSSPGQNDAPPAPPPSDGGGGGGGGGDDTPPPDDTADCPTGTTEVDPVGGRTTCSIEGVITDDVTLTGDANYRLNGRVDVGVDVGGGGDAADGDPASLTIEAGAVIFGASGSDFLVVNRGSQILVNGAQDNPVIMTAQQDLEGTVNDNDRGLWGGFVMLGRAPINSCDAADAGTAACENLVEGTDAFYGGDQPTDNSGRLNFLQVKFAGNAISQGNELNGITLAGIGSGTEIDFVQVHNNLDDGIEWFGGTVNATHIVLSGIGDDAIDWSEGWIGNLQFGLVVQGADGDGDHGIEAGNSSLPPQFDQLKADGRLSNVTFVGASGTDTGLLFRGGTDATVMNSIVVGHDSCLDIDGQDSLDRNPTFQSVLFDCATTFVDDSADGGETAAEIQTVFNDGGANNLIDEPNSLNSRFFPGPVEQGMTAFDPTSVDAFFENTGYVGAFGPDETPTANWASGWTFGLFEDPTCPAGTTNEGTIGGVNRCGISGVVTDELRLTRGNAYELQGRVDVGVDVGGGGDAPDGDPGTLIVESGVTIFGESGSDFLVVNRGSQIFVNGTSENPVLMTAVQDLNGTQAPNDRGLWGGFVMLGRAPINSCDAADAGTAACENLVEGTDAFYGGDQPADNSGRLNFLQVKFAGNAISQGNELNGITLAGIGSGTDIDFVQVHNNLDDGIEWFGGTVNAKHIVLTGIGDDAIDWSEGWIGNLQFGLVLQGTDGDGDHGIEAGNSSLPPQFDQLKADGRLSNVTFVGATGTDTGLLFRGGTDATIVNSIVVGHDSCLDIDGQDSLDRDPTFHSVLLDCATTFVDDSADGGETSAEVQAVVENDGTNIVTDQANTLTDTFVNGTVEAGIAAFDPTTIDPFFEAVDHIGAVRDVDDNWWRVWTCGLETGADC